MTAEELESIVGKTSTARIIAEKRGMNIYIPKKTTTALINLTGSQKSATALSLQYGGCAITIPTGRKWIANAMKAQGYSLNETAKALGVTCRSVSRMLQNPHKQAF